MATAIAPQAPDKKKYEPENPIFYSMLRNACIGALQGEPILERKAVWLDRLVAVACAQLETITYFSEAGHLAPALGLSLNKDVQAIREEIGETWLASDQRNDVRVEIIVDKLDKLWLGGSTLSSR